MKAAVYAIKFFEKFSSTGLRGKITEKFFSGLLKMIKPRAKVIDSNLLLAYPESNENWRKEIRGKVYENLAWTITEILALQRDPSQALDWVKKINHGEKMQELLKNKQGVIFLTGHFGNWELLGTWYGQYTKKYGHEMHIVFQDFHDKDIWEYVKGTRERGGMILHSKFDSVQTYARQLKKGMHLAVLNDIAGTGRMMVPFMGHDATNMPGPAVMAMLSGVPMIPVCIYRNAPFEHEVEFLDPIKIPDKNFSHDERMKIIIDESNKALEYFIRKRPEQWFWLHKRWRP